MIYGNIYSMIFFIAGTTLIVCFQVFFVIFCAPAIFY